MLIPFSFAGLVLGIITYGEFNIIISLIMATITIVACVFVSILKRKFNLPLFCALIFFILGTYLYHSAINPKSDFSLYKNQEVTVYGRICEIPNKSTKNYRYTVNVKLLEYNNTTTQTNENIIISTPVRFNYDDTICAKGTLKEMGKNQNQNTFDYSLYYKSQHIQYTMYCEQPVKCMVKLTSINLHSVINKIRNSAINLINSHFDTDKAAILSAITVGYKNSFSEDFNEIIDKTGIKRCMYPAFLHIMIILSLVSLTRTFIHNKYRIIIITVILLIYGAFNSYNPIFMKSVAYVVLTYLFKFKYGYVYKPDILLIVTGIILAHNPLLIYNGGFIISVVASILIFAFGELLYNNLKNIKTKRLRQAISTNFILSIGLMPLCAYYFGGVSTYQIPVTLIFIPLTLVLLIFSPITLIALSFFGKAPILHCVVDFILTIYIKIANIVDKLPHSHTTIQMPGIFIIIAFYLFVYALYLYFDKRRFKIPLTLGVVLSCILIIAEIISSFTMQLTFIDVGQGDAALISIPYHKNILIDGGGSADYQEDYNIGEEIFVPYLERKGKTNIDAIFISHYHKDHVEGVIAAMEKLNVKEIYMPNYLGENELRKTIESHAKKYNIKINYITKDTTYNLGNGITIDAITPTKLAMFTEDENNTTVVYKMSYGNTSCLFTGDITSVAEFGLINEGKNVNADILKVAHHGSANSTSSEFVQAVTPKHSVISVGIDNPFGFPRDNVIDNLRNTNILRTDINGNVTFIMTKSGIKHIKTSK